MRGSTTGVVRFVTKGGVVGWTALLGASLCLAGCGGAVPCPSRPFGEAEALLDALARQQDPVRTLQAEARVEQRGPRGRIRGRVRLMLRRPGALRFDVMTRLGPAAILTSDGERFALLDLKENRFLQGPTCARNTARLLGIQMEGEQLARLLVGDVPRLTSVERIALSCEQGSYLIVLEGRDGRRQRVAIEVAPSTRSAEPAAQRLRLRRVEMLGPQGELRWRVELEGHRPVEGTPQGVSVELPETVFFEDRREGQQVRIRIKEVRAGIEPPEGAFRQRPRGGMTIERVACEPAGAEGGSVGDDAGAGGERSSGSEGAATAAERGRLERARRLYREGEAAYRRGDFRLAARKMAAAYEARPSAALAYNVARVLERMGEFGEAIGYYERYLRSGEVPEEEEHRLRARIEELRRGEERLRSQLFTEAPDARAMSAEARAFYERGVKLFERGEMEAALEAFSAALQFAPLPEIYFNLGVVAERLGRRRDAADYFSEYLKARPDASDRDAVRVRIDRLRGR